MVYRRIITNEEKLIWALKYPDYPTWRDINTIQNGKWPDGKSVYLSDPELRPFIDEESEKIRNDIDYARDFIRKMTNNPDQI